jgi:hypothetical protein
MTRIVLLSAAIVSLVSCGGSHASATIAPGGSPEAKQWPADDRSLCQGFVHWKTNPQFEVSETAGPGSFKPNIRRVFKVVGERDDRHTVVLCREIDTNLDGIKDVVRTFNDKGEPLHEEADTNYDGKIDDWTNFAEGRVSEEDVDTTLAAGRPNLWKFYVDGQLSRVRRNTHCPSGRPDVWEIYYKNRLERVGSDANCDSHVDRWDRDAQLMAQEEAQSGVEVFDGGAAVRTASGSPAADQSVDGGAGASDAGRRPHRANR